MARDYKTPSAFYKYFHPKIKRGKYDATPKPYPFDIQHISQNITCVLARNLLIVRGSDIKQLGIIYCIVVINIINNIKVLGYLSVLVSNSIRLRPYL